MSTTSKKLTRARKKCDRALQELNKKNHKSCEACGGSNQVGHHWIEKSRSARLRYEMDNIVPLCNSCHSKIHNLFGSVMNSLSVADIIRIKRGEKWHRDLQKKGREIIKVNLGYYEQTLSELKDQV